MRNSLAHNTLKGFFISILFFSFFGMAEINLDTQIDSALRSILPEIKSWKFSEAPQNYLPETLYEYINGAAEIYLAYDFKELIVGQYEKPDQGASITIEIYDMGSGKNSFGIYSAERFPDSKFISIGNQGYLEEDVLNFIVGKYYIKLLCFDCNEKSEESLKLFSLEIANRVKDKETLPQILTLFPKAGLIQNSEKYILHNFMGYSFLHNGYVANYRLEDLEFDCFFIEGKSGEEALRMLKQYLDAKSRDSFQKIPQGYHLRDRYYHNIYLARIENYICGVMKIKDGSEEVGKRYLGQLTTSLEK
ncbi:MAG: hypothetical protein JSV96_11800 [Candidatus Aminicenantes bacterium]|nr:MAG: hypothetical protein JSV96_11800 [Candidatus Aminicenantes bacterium]